MKKLHAIILTFFVFALLAVIFTFSAAAVQDTVYYSAYGAVGDGVTNDFEAIRQAHKAANAAKLPVKADPGATYYIPGAAKSIEIKTDTDWGDARFIIDDSVVTEDESRHNIFIVSSYLDTIRITEIESLAKNQTKLELALPHDSLIIATDDTTTHYVRFGINADNGVPQLDLFIVDKDGNVAPDTPIVWDFDNITSMTACPIDEELLTIQGGHFTTIANQAKWGSPYYSRGISVRRSNVELKDIYHAVEGEKAGKGAPYIGFFGMSRCAYVTLRNCSPTGHLRVADGTYDIILEQSSNVSFIDCKQTNDINDVTLWGVIGSNFTKNLLLDSVRFSRFDAHKGVTNATIRNSELGHQGIALIGFGTFLIEDSTVRGRSFINLREDYGSTWRGDIIIRRCKFIPSNGRPRFEATVVNGINLGNHDFGYDCHMPYTITIDELFVDDSKCLCRTKLFGRFDYSDIFTRIRRMLGKSPYPYELTKDVYVKDFTTKSGRCWALSGNKLLFRRYILPNVNIHFI